jgi:hypothetical protein
LTKRLSVFEQGKSSGDFMIPDSISSGTYAIRAWPNWMRNINDDFIFEKEIKVLNNFEAPTNHNSSKKKSIKIASSVVKDKTEGTESIQFFPEGGSLADSITSILAFR